MLSLALVLKDKTGVLGPGLEGQVLVNILVSLGLFPYHNNSQRVSEQTKVSLRFNNLLLRNCSTCYNVVCIILYRIISSFNK